MFERAILAGVLVLATLLMLTNLANGRLWQDEAQTALIAETVLSSGVPLGTDGVNYYSQELGAEYGPGYVWRWHTWFPFYLLAGFFGLFGVSTWTARLPFALFGIATVGVAYLLGRELFRSPRAGGVAGALLATSVPFLVLSRQSRYYSLAAFFSILGLYAYRRLVEGAGRRFGVLFVTALVLLFHTHYVYFATLLAATLADAALWNRGALRRVGMLAGISVGLVLPFVVWISTIPYAEQYRVLDPVKSFFVGRSLVGQLGSHVVPWGILLLAIALALWSREPAGIREAMGKRVAPLYLYVVSTLAVLAVSAPAVFFRYLAPLLPVCCVLMAGVVEAAACRHRVAGAAVFVGLLAFQPLGSYAYELTHDFDGPVDGIVRYLEEHARPRDVVAMTYEDLPVKFYTQLRVLGGLTGENMAEAEDATWIILRKYTISAKDRQVRQYLLSSVEWDRYERIVIDSPDTPFQNRESPQDHRFRTDGAEDRVVIFHRIAP